MYRDKNDTIEDSFQAFLVEESTFTDIEEYPIIEEWMLPKQPPKKIMPFDKAINYHGDLRDTYICFYSRDPSFERVRKSPKRYLPFFKRCAGLIGFDFSIHSDMPLIKQKSQMNDNLSLTYFYGQNGCPVIPNIRWGIEETAEEYLSAIPKNGLVAIGTHGFCKRTEQKAEWICCLEKLIRVADPSGIVVYGNEDRSIFEPFKNQCQFFFYEPWYNAHRKKMQTRAPSPENAV